MLSIKNNVLEWTFRNISLPDSNTNESASHGYIIYRIKVVKNTKFNYYIHNKASIYFDYNLPVVTNTSSTYIWETSKPTGNGSSARYSVIQLYPVPSSRTVWLKYSGDSSIIIKPILYDEAGRQVAALPKSELIPFIALEVNLPFLQKGIYFLKVMGSNFSETHKIIVLQ